MILTKTKTCPGCGKEAPPESFRYYSHKQIIYNGRLCEECRRKQQTGWKREWRKNGPKHKPSIWTEERLTELVRMFPEASNQAIAERLGLKKENVSSKAQRLGLHKSKEYMQRLFSGMRKNKLST